MSYVDFHKHDKYKRSKKYDYEFRIRYNMSQQSANDFDNFYSNKFKNLEIIQSVEQDRSYQKIGIDKIIITSDSKISVDEKVTRTGCLLTKLSYTFLNTGHHKHGWYHYSKADYISVRYMNYIYMIPMNELRKYVDSNMPELKRYYGNTFIDNKEIEVNVLNIPLEIIEKNVMLVERYRIGDTQTRLL